MGLYAYNICIYYGNVQYWMKIPLRTAGANIRIKSVFLMWVHKINDIYVIVPCVFTTSELAQWLERLTLDRVSQCRFDSH